MTVAEARAVMPDSELVYKFGRLLLAGIQYVAGAHTRTQFVQVRLVMKWRCFNIGTNAWHRIAWRHIF